MARKIIKTSVVIILFLFPFLVSAAAPFYYAGWLPFWKKTDGAMDTALNLEKLDEISPFSYEVRPDGTLVDKLKIHEGLWPGWLLAAHDSGIKIIPSIAWFDGNGIHKLLSNTKKRRAHEDIIAKLVKDEKIDGIDIDYESKKAETNPYFSLFIKGLWLRLHPKGKILSCTIETRMPADSRNAKFSDNSGYANDYAILNKYCDQVRIMTYDQGVIDIKLNAEKGNGKIYAPVSDPDWAEKIIKEAIKTISRKKIMLGVPTYGYEYEITWANGATTYRRLRSINYLKAMDLAETQGINPSRNSAGELSLIYTSSTLIEVSPILRWNVSSTPPDSIPPANLNSTTAITRYVSFTDAESIRQKIALAKKYKLRGVAIFKLDGEADPAFWNEIK